MYAAALDGEDEAGRRRGVPAFVALRALQRVERPVQLDGVECARGERELVVLRQPRRVEHAAPAGVAPAGQADADAARVQDPVAPARRRGAGRAPAAGPSPFQFCHQGLLALGELLTEGLEVEAGLLELREELRVLLLDVMLDVFAQNRHLGVEQLVAGLGLLDLGDQVFRRGVLDLGLVEQPLVLQRVARRG